MAWPVKAEKFKYRGKEVWVLPVMRDMFPSIAIKGPQGMSREKGHAAALLRNVMNSRRLIYRPRGFGQGIVPVPMSVVKGCRMSALGQKRT